MSERRVSTASPSLVSLDASSSPLKERKKGTFCARKALQRMHRNERFGKRRSIVLYG